MIGYKDVLSMPFLMKSRFTGSLRGMRYSIYKVEERSESEEEKPKVYLEAAACPGPYSVDSTADELFTRERFSFDEEGRKAAIDWLNDHYEKNRDFFEEVFEHPFKYYQKHHK